MEMESASMFWVGLDWGDKAHTLCAYQPATETYISFSVPHTPEGLREMADKLRALGDIGGIAVECSRNLVVQALLDGDFVVYVINPKLSSKWRKGTSVSGAKSDAGDALILAEGLWNHRRTLHPLQPQSAPMRELECLVNAQKDLIGRKTSLVQALKDLLKRYHPQMLAFFDDWTGPTAWEFLLAFPTPQALASASKGRLCAFLRRHHIGISPLWESRIASRLRALEWPSDPAREESDAWHAQSLVKMLLPLEKQLCLYREKIERMFPENEKAHLFRSLPGAGPKLAPRLCTIFSENLEQYDAADALRKLSGVAPVTKQSGGSRNVKIRRDCRKSWRDTLHLFAHFSKRKSVWARAYYQQCRERGNSNATALRKLAYKWLGIIFRMCKEKKTYDEKQYIEQLRIKNSPTYQFMLKNGYLNA